MNDFEKIVERLKIIIVAERTAVDPVKLNYLYNKVYGTSINYQKFGFKSLYDLLRSIPNHIKINEYGSSIELVPIVSSAFADLEKLITAPGASRKTCDKRSHAIFVQEEKPVSKEPVKPLKFKMDLDILKDLESEILGEQSTHDNVEQRNFPKPNTKLPHSSLKEAFFNGYQNEKHSNQKNTLPRLDSAFFNPMEIAAIPQINANYQNLVLKEKFTNENKFNYFDKKIEQKTVKIPTNFTNNNNDDSVKKRDLREIFNEKKEAINVKKDKVSANNDNNIDKKCDLRQILNKVKNETNDINFTISSNDANNNNDVTENKVKKTSSMKRESKYFNSKRKSKGVRNTASSYLENRLEIQNCSEINGQKKSFLPNSLRKNLKRLFDANPKGVWLTNLIEVYGTLFSENLRKYMGSSSILDFCTENDDVFKIIRPGVCDWLVFSVDQQIPKDCGNDDPVIVPKSELIPPQEALPEVTDEDMVVIEDKKRLNICLNSDYENVKVKKEPGTVSDMNNLMAYPPNVLTNKDDIECQWVYYKPDFWFEVNVLEVFNPSKFWMNVSKFDCFKNIMNEVQKYYEVQHKCYQMKKCHMSINQYCVIRYQEKNKSIFRRAKIINCLQNIAVVEVFLIDYGFIMDCPLGDVFYLKKTFAKYPQQAVRAKLYNIKPFETFWELKAVDKFIDLTHKVHLIASVKVAHQEDKIIEVVLKSYDEDNNKVDIGEKLVKSALANYIDKNQVVKEFITFENIENGEFPFRPVIADKNEPMNILFLKFLFNDLVAEKNCQTIESNCLFRLENRNLKSNESEFQDELEYFFKKFSKSDSESESDSGSDIEQDNSTIIAMNKQLILATVLPKINLGVKRCSSSDSDSISSEEIIQSNDSYLKNSKINLSTVYRSEEDDGDDESSN